jgi:hypothetical protein
MKLESVKVFSPEGHFYLTQQLVVLPKFFSFILFYFILDGPFCHHKVTK